MVATINAALRAFAIRRQARDIIAAFDQVQVDFTDSDHAWRYGGGRNLSRFAEDAREADTV
ncbi:MAG: hypothetical protein JO100_06790 [Pseudonocardia sp.]|nr:hypothetical protein [Pseudonocardia sp.]